MVPPGTIRLLLPLMALLLPTTPLKAENARPIVAVFNVDRDPRVKLPRAALESIASYIASRLTESGKFQVIPRDQLKTRLLAQKMKSFKDCYDQTCQIEIGKELAAEKSLSTKIVRLGKRCTVTMTFYDLRKATTESAATQHGGCKEDNIVESVDKTLNKLFGESAGQKAAAEEASRAAAERAKLTAEEKAPQRRSAKEYFSLGFKYANGKGVPRDDKKAASLYHKACEGGDMKGCYNLGKLFGDGRGVPRDDKMAATLYHMACDKGHMKGCYNLGNKYTDGKGVPRDYKKAVSLYRKACDSGHIKGCNNLGRSYAGGKGVARDNKRAASLYRLACDGGYMIGCYNLGNRYAFGKGVPKDHKKAVSLFKKSCKSGYKLACKRAK